VALMRSLPSLGKAGRGHAPIIVLVMARVGQNGESSLINSVISNQTDAGTMQLAGDRAEVWKVDIRLPGKGNSIKAGPPNHLDDKVDSDQCVVNKKLSLSRRGAPDDGLWTAALRALLGTRAGITCQSILGAAQPTTP